ncbi:uncharacterized protein RCH25_007874 [Pelodytes ibericus]
MGTGVCSRRQKSLLHTGFCLLAVLGLASGAFIYNYILQKAKESEDQALKFKQQQEALSAQLQVVYEHRSRLERSLQKERGEHKKTKEDFLVYKLEAQEALNKEKQDSMNRYGALNSQHSILKNQHEDVKKQLTDLQGEHSSLKLEHRKALENHSQKVSQLEREKNGAVAGLQDTISKLREESKLLRKAHQDVHTQLVSAQVQVNEFRQLRDALRKMPSFKQFDAKTKPRESPATDKKISTAQMSQNVLVNTSSINLQIPGSAALPTKRTPYSLIQPSIQTSAMLRNQSTTVHFIPPKPLARTESENRLITVTRTVNTLQSAKKEDPKAATQRNNVQKPNKVTEKKALPIRPLVLDNPKPIVSALTVKKPVPIQSWQDLVNKVNARMDEDEKLTGSDENQEANHINVLDVKEAQRRGGNPAGKLNREHDELEMDAGMIDREENLHRPQRHVAQEPLIPEDAADPAKDPNNQGEDEFEEAEVDRPGFEVKAEGKKKRIGSLLLQKAHTADVSREEPEEHYQDDQEQDFEEQGDDNLDHGGDLQQDHKDMYLQSAKNRRDEYY